MKVGILTYHRTLNYGACLQAIATRVMLENMGHKVYYVDYWPNYHRAAYSLFSLYTLSHLPFKEKIKYFVRSLKYYRYRKQRKNSFSVFFSRFISPYCRDMLEEYDAVIYGSDQIWRKQKALNDYNLVYFGNSKIKATKKIAFSASMGILPTSNADIEKIRIALQNFSKISVRENDLAEFLKVQGFSNALLTLDPTLLLKNNEWRNLLGIKKSECKEKYVIVYSVGGASAFDMDEVYDYANKNDCKVKIIHSDATCADTDTDLYTISPVKFVELIDNATCIFTSSFHGLAFSIIFEKDFYASFNRNPMRAKTLLNSLGCQHRYIEPYNKIRDIAPIDYTTIHNKLEALRGESIKYLMEI